MSVEILKNTLLLALKPIQVIPSSCFPSSKSNSKCKLAVLPSTGSEKVVIGITNRNTLPAVAGILGKRMVTSGGIGALYTEEKLTSESIKQRS